MNRDTAENALARQISRLSQAQLDKLMAALGDPPNAQNVPAAFWDDYAAEMQSAILPALEKMYLDAAEQQANADEMPEIEIDWTLVKQDAAAWAQQYSFELVKGITDTTRRELQDKVAEWFKAPGKVSDLADALEATFGPVRAGMIAATEITRASVQGQAATIAELNRQGTQMLPYFATSEDDLVCEICAPLDGKQVDESQFPPLHVSCRCDLVYKFE